MRVRGGLRLEYDDGNVLHISFTTICLLSLVLLHVEVGTDLAVHRIEHEKEGQGSQWRGLVERLGKGKGKGGGKGVGRINIMRLGHFVRISRGVIQVR